MKALELRIRGMDCVEEVILLKRELGPIVGGEERLSFDVLNGKMTVAEGPPIPLEDISSAVARAGLRAEVWREQGETPIDPAPWWRRPRTVLTGISGAFLLAGFVSHWSTAGSFAATMGSEGLGPAQEVPLLIRALYFIAVLAGGWQVFPKAWLAVRHGRADMNLLMTVAIGGAIGIGEWFEAAAVSFLFALALTLEAWSVARARRAVASLLKLTPTTARIRRADGTEHELAAEEIPVGASFVVKPGERIALDGLVAEGETEVNQAPITGESVPVPKRAGDHVFAGTINGDGAVIITSTKPARDTTLARIIRMVGEAQSRRAPTEQWVERFARIYTPSVMALAVVMFLIPPLFLNGSWMDWLYRALVLLVIACPCALVISTPVSIVAALASAARNGVLIKGGAFVEVPAHLRAIAFDKTGTLTQGHPAVAELVALEGSTEAELLEIASSLEARSEHPLAKAILAFARDRGITVVPADGFTAIQGRGATGRVKGTLYWIGSHRYLEERAQETPDVHARLDAMAREGRSVVIVGDDRRVCGLIAVADPIRPNARTVLNDLRGSGIEHLVMLTGDNRETGEAIAREAGLAEVRAQLLPAEKVAAVEDLVARYGSVAMVGDGVNDAPAMGRATLGIAMGAAGSDAAIEAADIALMSDDLAKLPWLISHSKKALRVIYQNIVFSLAVKAVFVVLTFSGHASLWSAIAADMGASLLVIVNALRLLGRTPRALAGSAAT